MLGFIKRGLLKHKQGIIRKRYPGVNITLHLDMPASSMNKMVEMARIVEKINSFEPEMKSCTDAELRQKSQAFRQIILAKDKERAQEILGLKESMAAAAIPEEKERMRRKLRDARNRIFEDVLPEAFALVREASRRTIGLRHFDVQLAGGIILHEGKISEMSTGEGKTLVATLPACLNALLGRGVHIVTVNDYLARRDREWMGPVFEFLGLTVGVIQHEMSDDQRRLAYACDITYGTNNEFGFDYLRDNMKYSGEDLVQRPFYYAIVDEVDSILIDEARTPLIISGPSEESTDKYYTARQIGEQLKGRRVTESDEIDAKHKGLDLAKGFDYTADEKNQTIALTEDGEAKATRFWGVESLHSLETIEYRHHTIQALRAKEFYDRDVDYVVKDGQVVIVDEFTGRLMPGRRWSDGLHQAVEAKEGLKIERENQTLATITFQNYFRMYEKLAGMTGTAFTEAAEFENIYQLEVEVIPTNRKLCRVNQADRIYKTEKEKFAAVVDEIADCHQKGQPVLVGTISIEKSEKISEMLKKRGIAHQVLNAKYHEMEAQIIAQAGRYKGVTIATNMAGRGTDILLGGNPDFIARSVAKQKLKDDDPDYQQEYGRLLERFRKEAQAEHDKVVEVGGLHVLGTERHEARRIDNQLRGRSGRQGDPGSSRFYVSLGDDLMRLFVDSNRMVAMMEKLGLEDGQVIEHSWITHSIERAQRRVEQHNFEIRKQLLEYDNVMNKQREIIYGQRRQVLEGASLKENIIEMASGMLERIIDSYSANKAIGEELDTAGLLQALRSAFGLEHENIPLDPSGDIKEQLAAVLIKAYEEKERLIGSELLRYMERMLFLQIIDTKWKDHLYAMDNLREGIGLRAYGQRDPLVEYKREAFHMFSEMMSLIEGEVVEAAFRLKAARQERVKTVFGASGQQMIHPEARKLEPAALHAAEDAQDPDAAAPRPKPVQLSGPKVGRNDPCPCGSGKKYKKCCGQ